MINKDLLETFPSKRIKPIDGMPVTADVWEESHTYHTDQQRYHNLLNHGTGIVTGLDIIASDPPDTSVYILPGIAIDPIGRTIVLPQPLAYDVGENSDGLLYIVMTYGEGRPKSDGDDGVVLYIKSQFGIEARPTLPEIPFVELARVMRETRDSSILLASDPEHPGMNELDLRFRQSIGVNQPKPIRVGISSAGKVADKHHITGMSSLARALRRTRNLPVWVDKDVALDGNLEDYTLIYMIAEKAFKLSAKETDAVKAYLEAGGTLLLESCRQAKSGAAPASDKSFTEMATALGGKLDVLKPGHSLMDDPFLFGEPPVGYEADKVPEVTIGDGIIFSTAGYGRLWLGECRGRSATREEIRAGIEWGHNILQYAAHRKNGG